MTNRISEAEARELMRIMHEDQGSRNPAFSPEFALDVINTVSNWFKPQTYYGTLWIERWEEPKAVEEAPSVPAPAYIDDDIPF